MHHIVSDGWSMGLFIQELSALYGAFSRGEADPLPPLPVQYADYAAWQRRWVDGDVLREQADFWKRSLEGAPELLELPTDRARPAQQDFAGATAELELDEELTAGLRALGRRHGATLFMTLLAGWAVVLARLSGQDDVVVGTPAANRGRSEIEGLIGFFINTLALRVDLSGSPTVAELLARLRAGVLAAQQRQDMPFEQVVELVQPTRSLAHNPLFQVVLAWQNAPRGSLELPGLALGSLPRTPHATAQFDLSLTLLEAGPRIVGSVTYATSLFERATIERWIGFLRNVLEAMAADDRRRVDGLTLLPEAERTLVVDEWNRTARPWPRGVGMNELFEAQVAARPDAPALVWGDVELSYRELDARANRLAHVLRGYGVGPDARVGVMLERGVELVVSILAVIKAGGAYVPLDPGYPAERLRLMLEDSGVRVLLTRSDLAAAPELAGAFDADGLTVVHLDRAADALASQPAGPVRGGADPENLAYIVYTSGSTGRPKGVMVAHRHVVQLVCETDYVRFAPGDRVAQASNASFDALTFEAWGAFLNGATLVGIPRDVLLSPPAFREALREQGITTLYQTTALLNQLSREQPDIFAPLREVLFGGQAADADSVRRLLKAGKPRRLLHMYGPTETTAWCSYENVEHVAEDALTVSVGRGTGNQRIYLLDSALNPVPVGVAGEAYVGGDGVVRGYLDRPALTAERFLPDPFAAEPGTRMYRTGDRLRWTAAGRLEFVGRVDEQVKVRGFRIEPGEIEAVLTAHGDVSEARVIVREDEPGEQRLVAYVVGGADADALREHLRRSLPEYMVPTAFVALDAIPLTPNGKLDVRALPAPEYASADRYVAPRTPAEEVLAEIWAGVLGLETVGVHDDFFQLGGHSLLATRVVSRAREVFGVEVPVRAVFEGPTVARLAERVEALRSAGASVLPPVERVDRGNDLPLSFSQERLWFLDRMQPDSAFYNLCLALRLRGGLDHGAMERTLGEIVRRHEALRTVFPDRRGGPVQVILPFAGFTLPVEDVVPATGGEDEDEELEAEARRIASEEAARSFDLETGPLFRARLLRLDERDHVLLVAMHHIVSDGWSLGVLYREISAHYGAFSQGRESPLPELPVQYVDYAVWQREHQQGEILGRQLAYWRDRLAGAPALLELPTDFPRPAVQTHRGAEERTTFPREVLDGLRELGRREGATLYMTLLAAFQVLLSKYSGSEDVVVGSPIAGRTRRELEELIGFFVNALALRTDLSGDPAFREVLGRVREVTLSAYEHQAVSFEKLVAELQPERSLSHAPIFQVLFSVGEAGGAWRDMPGLHAEPLGVEVATTTFDLNVVFAEGLTGLQVAMAFNTDLFERATARRMLGHMGRVLEQVAARPGLRMSELEVVGEAERRQVVQEWNATAAPYPRDRCLHELFEDQVERTPDAVAVVFGDEKLTYAELNARANQLAHYLRERGVGPDERVGFCVERSLEMMTGLLAVLKAGGGYVPLDPAYPADRLRYMLEDSAPAAVLTLGAPRDLFAGTRVPIVDLGAEAEAWADHPRGNPALGALGPDNLVYAIYTSGSTGRPKGVAMPHRPLVNLLAWQEPDWRYPRAAVTLQFTTISFDVSLQEIFSAWNVGGTLVVAPEEARHDPAALLELVEREGVERLSVPYVTLQHVAEYGASRGIAPPSLREAQTAGEQLRITDAIRRWFGAMGIPLHNHYGPSETHVMTSFALAGPAEEWPLLPSIGGPIANTTTYVLDRYLCPVPQGVPGELYLGGDCLARGYLNRPDMTADRFRPDPFGGEPGARMYRTGDRVRWLPEGVIDFLGRVDHQVKIRGVRIEPAEVEAVLRRHERVAECVVLVREDEPGDKRLVAYVVGGVEVDALREHVRSCVPEYMVPAAFVLMDSLPATPNGKLDRRALPAPEYASDEERYVAPRTPAEETLAAIWSEVLGIERVGVQDNFFELGGHSLLATRVISRARDAFGSALSVRAIFEDPTIEGLARVLAEQGSATGADSSGQQASVEDSTTHQLLSMIDDLSEEELDRLLSAQS
jgi:amino acid adenylation domain-containing protein